MALDKSSDKFEKREQVNGSLEKERRRLEMLRIRRRQELAPEVAESINSLKIERLTFAINYRTDLDETDLSELSAEDLRSEFVDDLDEEENFEQQYKTFVKAMMVSADLPHSLVKNLLEDENAQMILANIIINREDGDHQSADLLYKDLKERMLSLSSDVKVKLAIEKSFDQAYKATLGFYQLDNQFYQADQEAWKKMALEAHDLQLRLESGAITTAEYQLAIQNLYLETAEQVKKSTDDQSLFEKLVGGLNEFAETNKELWNFTLRFVEASEVAVNMVKAVVSSFTSTSDFTDREVTSYVDDISDANRRCDLEITSFDSQSKSGVAKYDQYELDFKLNDKLGFEFINKFHGEKKFSVEAKDFSSVVDLGNFYFLVERLGRHLNPDDMNFLKKSFPLIQNRLLSRLRINLNDEGDRYVMLQLVEALRAPEGDKKPLRIKLEEIMVYLDSQTEDRSQRLYRMLEESVYGEVRYNDLFI